MVRTLFFLSVTLYAVPTFHKDVQPILQKHCVSCHRPGEIGPMALRTYQEVRPWAAAIQQAVKLEKMPPWGASPAHGKFSNDPTLSAAEKETLNQWIAAKTPEGNPKDAPQPRVFVDGWNIKTPELVLEMPVAYEVPATGTIDYTYFVMPTNFTEDRWIQSAEVRPGNRAVVHHVIVYVREPGNPYMRDAVAGVPYVPKRGGSGGAGEYLVGYTPGKPAMVLEPGKAKLIKAGSDLIFQMHYTSNGKPAADRTKVGFNFAKTAPQERVMTVAVANGSFAIPAGADNYPVDSKLEFLGPAHLVTMWPHMHVRGKSMRYELVDKAGQRQTLLDVPKYDFNWQMRYIPEEPLRLSSGSAIEVFATFDNSPNNKHNPDPTKVVRWGDQSWEEMMIGFMEISFDAKLKPSDVFQRPVRQRAAAE
ncbi:MAG: cytochrome c [Acidobacteria bacterium]|nr:cytochrome c [Acidobacteriota bacterium]